MSSDQECPIEAVVLEVLPNSMLRVQTSKGCELLVHASSQVKGLNVRLLPGVKVWVEVSPYSRGRGRIVGRPSG